MLLSRHTLIYFVACTLCNFNCFSFLRSISATFTKAANGNSCSFLFMKFNITRKSTAYPLAYLNCLITFVVSSRISSISPYGSSLQCCRDLKMHIMQITWIIRIWFFKFFFFLLIRVLNGKLSSVSIQNPFS